MAENTILIENVHIAGQNRVQLDIRVQNGKIVKIHPDLPSEKNIKTIDAKGGYIIPGLIDAHTHLASVPGSEFRNDSHKLKECLWKYQLHSYLAAGVTSVLDNAITFSFAKSLEKYFTEGGFGPRVFYLTPFFTPPNGYFGNKVARGSTYSSLTEPVKSRNDVINRFSDTEQLEPVGIKVTMESGLGPIPVFKTHTKKMRQTISEEAQRRKTKIFVHSMTNKMHLKALELKPHALVHAGFYSEKPDQKTINAIKASNASVVTTVSVNELPRIEFNREILNEPLLKLLVPPIQVKTAKQNKAWDHQNENIGKMNTPKWIPTFVTNLVMPLLFNDKKLKQSLNSVQSGIRALRKAGIPLVMGADAGNWPMFISLFHGYGSIREIELLAESGIPLKEVITMATLNGAKLLDKESKIGSIKVDYYADFVIFETDPTQNIEGFRKPLWVIKNGIVKTPFQWMSAAPNCSKL